MTQKQLITANNAELEKHKQDILNLPMADDVKNGRYVWGKYEYTPQQTISGTTAKISASRGTNIVLIRNCTTDLTKVDLNLNSAKFFFLNFEGSGIRFTQSGGNTYVQLGDGYDITKITNITPTGCDLTVSENVLAEYTNSVITQKLSVTIPPSKGSFLAYTVSDSETAHPDGGEKDGFWWERVKEGLPITKMGFTKFTYGSFTLSSSNEGSYTIEHNLGAKLKKLIVYTEDSLVRKNYGIRQLSLVDRYTSYSGGGEEYYFQFGAIQNSYNATREGFSTFESAIPRSDVTTGKVALKLDTVNYLVGGKKYYWMAMA